MDDEEQATLGTLRDQLTELTDPSTTEEAQGYARRFLNKQLTSPLATKQGEIMTKFEKEAEEARAVLRAAREKLAARRFNPSDKWYALSAALGAPTRVGGVGELASRAATALDSSRGRREKFEDEQRSGLLDYDKQMSDIATKMLAMRSGMLTDQGKIDADLAKESLKTLGKRVSPQANAQSKAQIALDQAYVKDYSAWVQDGAPVAEKSLGELAEARDRLRGYRIDENNQRVPLTEGDFLTRQLGPTGAVAGSIATVPFAGKAIQDVLMPGGADIREMVEATVQSSLRPILGAQFTEKEGERLIARVYNPRLKREVNAARVERLMKQIAEATRNKNAAARWFEEHGTLAGFKGKLNYSLNDFMPRDVNELSPNAEDNPDDFIPAVEPGEQPTADPAASTVAPQERINGRRVIDYKDLPKKKKRWFGFAEGGTVDDEMLVRMPDGSLVPAAADATQEDVDTATETPGEYDSVLSRAALASLGAGAGYVGARAGIGLGTGLKDRVLRQRETPAQARLLRLMERENLSPSDVSTSSRRYSRMGVPAMALDASPNLRALAEESLTSGGADALDLLDRLNARQAGARERSLEQVNKGLKPDEYFDKEKELKTKLYGDKARGIESESAPLYRKAEADFPAVSSKQLTQLLDTPSGEKAIKAAMKTMEDRKKPIGKRNPVTGAVTKYSLEFLNQVKIELDDMVGKAEKKGASGKSKTLKDLRNAFRSEIDAATTDPTSGDSPYKEARSVYEGGKKNLDTLQLGREEFATMEPAQLRDAVSKMTFEQKDLFRTGVSQKISEMLNNPSTDINAARRLIGSPAMQAKLETLFDSPNEFRVFQTALKKEMEIFENSQQLLGKEKSTRRRGTIPEEGRIARGAQKAPSLGVLSPTHWALKYLRRKPDLSAKEAGEIIQMLRAGTPAEMAEFEKTLGKKFGRAAARKRFSSKAGKIAALGGAGLGALFGGGDEATPPPAVEPEADDPALAGLDEEERKWATTPAFAGGGKVSVVKKAIEELKARHEQSPMDPEYLGQVVRNIALNVGEAPGKVWRMISSDPPPWTPSVQVPLNPVVPEVRIPAQPEALAPFARSMDFEKQRLKSIADSLDLRRDLSPAAREAMNTSSLAADQAYNRMWQEPTYQNMQRLSELVRALSNQAEQKKRRGGRIRRQFGGMTNHA